MSAAADMPPPEGRPSLYGQQQPQDGSPAASEEGGGGGGSPVRAPTLATRFYSADAAAAVRAASHLTGADGAAAGASNRCSSDGDGVLPQQQQQQRQQHPSIYSKQPTHHQQHTHRPPQHSDSHTSIVDLRQASGGAAAVVAVEHYIHGGGGEGAAGAAGGKQRDTFTVCTFNLAKVIMGAGMMAIPRAFMLLGLLPGCAIMALMACLVYFTLAELIAASATIGSSSSSSGGGPDAHSNSRSSNRSGSAPLCSYGQLVRATLGGCADTVLQLAVLVNCWVMNVVFVVVLGDILVGSPPEYGGLLPEWSGCRGPADAGCWWLRRDVVLGAVASCVLLPMAAMRSMSRLAVVNIIGVACNGVFAALMAALAASAAANGAVQRIPLLPDWSALGGGSPLLAAVAIASVVPVLLNCSVCHQSVHPLMPLLQPYSVARMQRLVALALALCNSLYLTVTICAGLVFGAALQPDVLSNVTSAGMAPLLGPQAAATAAALVRVGYLLSIMGSFVLLCYPLRQCLGDLLLPGGQQAVARHWLGLTAGLVGSAAAVGCYLPSIWGALALVGATASTTQAFIIPGLVVLSVERSSRARRRAWRATRLQQQQQQQLGSGAGNGGTHHLQAAYEPLLQRQQRDSDASEAAAARAGSWRGACHSVLRQAAAVLCLLIGVGLFVNSVASAIWDAAHQRAEGEDAGGGGGTSGAGAGLLRVYRRVLGVPVFVA